MLFNISSEDGQLELVKVMDSEVGKGVYASRPYPKESIIGEITGQIFKNPYTGTNYTFEANDGFQLEPYEPFRYLNHSCMPNCEFDWIETPAVDERPAHAGLFLFAIRNIFAREQFTIDYRWPASFAIPCQCRAPMCRGWVVDQSQVNMLPSRLSPLA